MAKYKDYYNESELDDLDIIFAVIFVSAIVGICLILFGPTKPKPKDNYKIDYTPIEMVEHNINFNS
jgi:hypothetical protein